MRCPPARRHRTRSTCARRRLKGLQQPEVISFLDARALGRYEIAARDLRSATRDCNAGRYILVPLREDYPKIRFPGGGALLMGRSSTCDVRFEEAYISRRHARLVADAGRAFLVRLTRDDSYITVNGHALVKDARRARRRRTPWSAPRGARVGGAVPSTRDAVFLDARREDPSLRGASRGERFVAVDAAQQHRKA